MTPLDDELRIALAARAAALPPSADPLAGIERRAARIHRRRTLTAALGAALAVSAVAVAVPALSGGDRADGPSRFATEEPSEPAPSAYALDPRSPWPLRGTPAAAQATFSRVWAARHPGSTLTPLFAQRYDPSGQDEEAFVATGPDGSRYGWITGNANTATLLVDEAYDEPMAALQFALPGDEVPRLVVVTTPSAREIDYAANGASFRDTTVTQPGGGRLAGIGVTPLEGPAVGARVRVLVQNGSVVYDEPARSAAPLPASTPPRATPTATAVARPANLLTWPAPGVAPRPADVAALEKAFATSLGRGSAQAAYRPLHSDLTESGVRYTVGQAWIPGDAQAYDVGWVQDRDNPPVFQRYLRTPAATEVRAYVLGVAATFSSDLLVVVPRPGIGQLSYSPDATSAFSPVGSGSSQIALLPRAAGTTADRLEVLDGNGNLDSPLYRGPVNAIVCGAPACP